MRIAYRVWSGIAAATFVVVAVVDINNMSDSRSEPASASSNVAPPSSGAGEPSWYSASPSNGYSVSGPSTYSGSPTSMTGGESVTVTDIIDGDTFVVSGNREVRVLGIDACEANTAGGREAADQARSQLMGGAITLTKQPGVETDPYGRELRYVQFGGTDFGRSMVMYPHTGVYEGRNDADPSYVSSLRSIDYGPRNCAGPTQTTTQAPPAEDDDDDVYVDPYDYSPGGGSSSDSSSSEGDADSSGGSSNTGDSGHPCLPGERDGDGDGYCGET